jgi:hypothetical protein
MTMDDLTNVDLGEYLLGKMAGTADKTAQLLARNGQVSWQMSKNTTMYYSTQLFHVRLQ